MTDIDFAQIWRPVQDQGASRRCSWGEHSPWFIGGIFSLCPYQAEGQRELPGVSFMRAQLPFPGALPHDLITPKGSIS